jgi:hypothetical protein
MGLDAYMGFITDKEWSEKEIKHLRYHLLHRFGDIVGWKEKGEEIITKKAVPYDTERKFYYDINLNCRYYGKKYKRGPGLQLAALLLYVDSYPGVKGTCYGNDGHSPVSLISPKEIAELMAYWITNAWLSNADDGDYEGIDRPVCEYCDMPMDHVGGSSVMRIWRCAGCQERLELPR